MNLGKFRFLFSLAALLAASSATSQAAVLYTETFDTNTSNWLNNATTPATPTYSATGGVGNSGYISFNTSFTSAAVGPFGAPPLQLMFRGNNAADASGDNFVGNWLSAGVQYLSVAVRHNYTSDLYLYARLDAGSGAAGSSSPVYNYPIAPDTWTTVYLPILNSNPPFLSYGAGNFNSVFTNIQNVQLGLYVPASTTFTDFRMDIDNVSISAVPEPGSIALGCLGVVGAGFMALRRRLKKQAA